MTHQKGFTLIEIVVVVVILGILSVTAAPKFMSIQDEAKTSSLQGLKGAIQNAIGMTQAQAILENKQSNPTDTLFMMGNDVNITYGSPSASADLEAVLNNIEQWTIAPEGVEAQNGGIVYGIENFNCAVEYVVATKNTVATVNLIGDACRVVGEGNEGGEKV